MSLIPHRPFQFPDRFSSFRCQPKSGFIRFYTTKFTRPCVSPPCASMHGTVEDSRPDRKKVGEYKIVPDEQSFYEQLYRAHHARILQLCRLWLNDSHEAEDATQEVFLKLFQASSVQDQSFAWRAWLTRVALNTCRDRRRSSWWKWWREKPVGFEEMPLPSRDPTPEEETVSREEREQIWRLFRGLSVRQQEVFALRYVEEWSVEEVAQTLGVTPGSVKQHLFRAVRHLRKALGGQR